MDIIRYGNPILRKKAEPVEEITDELRAFIHELIQMALHPNAVGIAAPQVGVSKAIFVIAPPLFEKGQIIKKEAKVYINPKLSNPSKETQTEEEGCLSVPGVRGNVTRPVSITVSAIDIHGNPFQETLTGYPARVLMHENDHINGVLFIDRLSPFDRKRLTPYLP